MNSSGLFNHQDLHKAGRLMHRSSTPMLFMGQAYFTAICHPLTLNTDHIDGHCTFRVDPAGNSTSELHVVPSFPGSHYPVLTPSFPAVVCGGYLYLAHKRENSPTSFGSVFVMIGSDHKKAGIAGHNERTLPQLDPDPDQFGFGFDLGSYSSPPFVCLGDHIYYEAMFEGKGAQLARLRAGVLNAAVEPVAGLNDLRYHDVALVDMRHLTVRSNPDGLDYLSFVATTDNQVQGVVHLSVNSSGSVQLSQPTPATDFGSIENQPIKAFPVSPSATVIYFGGNALYGPGFGLVSAPGKFSMIRSARHSHRHATAVSANFSTSPLQGDGYTYYAERPYFRAP